MNISDFALGALCAVTAALALLVTLAFTAAAWLWRKFSRWDHMSANRDAVDGSIGFAASLRAEPVRDGWLRRLWGWATRQGQS